MRMTPSEARAVALRCQGLDGSWSLPAGKEGAAQVAERLGYVQIDTIHVVERAHHHVLWSRNPDYRPALLHALQAEDRRVFEYWTHAASYVPMRDYRYYLPRMRAAADSPRNRSFLEGNAELVAHIRERIRAEGPVCSSDFERPKDQPRGSWWSWKPAKHALEVLFDTGELMVTERRNFERVYDFAERVLPAGTDTTPPTRQEAARFAICRVLGALGVSPLFHWSTQDREAVAAVLQEMVAAGEVVAVDLEDGGDALYALASSLEGAPAVGRPLHILSPFDNLVIWRRPLKRLFSFDYKLECYLPSEQRRYGYFCLPVLWGGTFIARLDAKADRKAKTLLVRRVTFEEGFAEYDGALPVLARKLAAFAAFNGCERVQVEAAEPSGALELLRRECAA